MILAKRLRRGNVVLYYEVGVPELKKDGREPPVLIYLTGHGLNLTAFGYQRSHFDNLGYASAAIDKRGDSKSTLLQNVKDYAMDDLMEDLESIISKEGFGKFTIVAHSAGTLLAQRYAATHGEKLDALVLLAASYDFKRTFARSPFRRLLLGISPLGTFVEIVYTMGADVFDHNRQEFYPDYTDEKFMGITDIGHLLKTVGRKNLEQVRAASAFGKVLLEWNTESYVQMIKAPTLIIQGDSDSLVPQQTAYELQERIPGARNIQPRIIPGGQHNLMFQHPRLVNEAMERFLVGEIYAGRLGR